MNRPVLAVATSIFLLTGCAREPEAGFLGDWAMTSKMGSGSVPASMTLMRDDGGDLDGVWWSRGSEMNLANIVVVGNTIEFDREVPGGMVLHYRGERDGGDLRGLWSGPFGEIVCNGYRQAEIPPPDASPDRSRGYHSRPIVERDGRTLLWAGENDDGGAEWFDVTDAAIDPTHFQFGIGKDTIASIDAPEYATYDDPRVAASGLTRETPVLGVLLEGVPRAYPVDVMSMHEVVNDDIAGKPYAVMW